jgi:hypothetical protein
MSASPSSLFTFPNPVNEKAARTVASGVVVLCVAAIAFGQPRLLVPLTYGFWARLATGPTLSPLGQLATRVIAPRLPGGPKLVPGPPKRFAQGMGVVFSSTAVILWFGFGQATATWAVIGLLAVSAFLEAAFAVCLGCRTFSLLMRMGVIPEHVCEACADLSVRHRGLARSTSS